MVVAANLKLSITGESKWPDFYGDLPDHVDPPRAHCHHSTVYLRSSLGIHSCMSPLTPPAPPQVTIKLPSCSHINPPPPPVNGTGSSGVLSNWFSEACWQELKELYAVRSVHALPPSPHNVRACRACHDSTGAGVHKRFVLHGRWRTAELILAVVTVILYPLSICAPPGP